MRVYGLQARVRVRARDRVLGAQQKRDRVCSLAGRRVHRLAAAAPTNRTCTSEYMRFGFRWRAEGPSRIFDGQQQHAHAHTYTHTHTHRREPATYRFVGSTNLTANPPLPTALTLATNSGAAKCIAGRICKPQHTGSSSSSLLWHRLFGGIMLRRGTRTHTCERERVLQL